MVRSYKVIVMSLLVVGAALIFAAGCKQNAETAPEPAGVSGEKQKVLRIAGVMSAEGGDVPEEALGVIYDALKESLDAAGLFKSRPDLTIEVFVSNTPESGGGKAALKVHSEETKTVVAEAFLEYSSAAELADKVADYLKKL